MMIIEQWALLPALGVFLAVHRDPIELARDAAVEGIVMSEQVSEPQIEVPRYPPGDYYLGVRTIDVNGYAGPYGRAQHVNMPPPLRAWVAL